MTKNILIACLCLITTISYTTDPKLGLTLLLSADNKKTGVFSSPMVPEAQARAEARAEAQAEARARARAAARNQYLERILRIKQERIRREGARIEYNDLRKETVSQAEKLNDEAARFVSNVLYKENNLTCLSPAEIREIKKLDPTTQRAINKLLKPFFEAKRKNARARAEAAMQIDLKRQKTGSPSIFEKF